MSHPWHHSESSARRFGGTPDSYITVHNFLDQTKAGMADFRHRAILHNAFGCFLAEQVFGTSIDNGAGKQVPTRLIAEQHVREDLGWIPSIQDWLHALPQQPWMRKGVAATDDADVPVKPCVTVSISADDADELLAGDNPGLVMESLLDQIQRAREALP